MTLRNGPFCILKRPVLERETARFRNQNDVNFVLRLSSHQRDTKKAKEWAFGSDNGNDGEGKVRNRQNVMWKNL